MKFARPVLGFAAFSGTGKTTLLTRVIPLLQAQGIRVAIIKHAHHDFDIDTPGKDSYELRKAGAQQVMIASDRRRALMTEISMPQEPDLQELVLQLSLDDIDLVLVEGFRHLAFPKIELHRKALDNMLLYPEDADIVAVASDHLSDCGELPALDINDAAAIAAFIVSWLGINSR